MMTTAIGMSIQIGISSQGPSRRRAADSQWLLRNDSRFSLVTSSHIGSPISWGRL